MRIGIFGGSFDPIHLGHLLVAEDVLIKLSLDKVVFIPSFHPPHRPPPVAPYHHRLKMVRLAVTTHPQFAVSAIEKDLPAPSYTVNTLTALRKSLTRATLYLILGYDQYHTIASWHRSADLTHLARLVVISRPGINKPARFPNHSSRRVLFLPVIPVAISAAIIRNRLAQKRSISYLVTGRVREYIYRHRIY